METPKVMPKRTSNKSKSKPKSKRSSPRRHDFAELPQFIQPLMLPQLNMSEQRSRRPKSEIVRELRRLYALSARADGEEESTSSSPPDTICTLEQLDCVRLTRHRIEQLLHSCNFELAVCNCFVRLNINAYNLPAEYRIAEILGVRELNEGYYVGKIPTNTVLHVRYEDICENFELNAISNMGFTLAEFELWRDNCVCQGIALPNTDLIGRKKVELYNALNSEINLTGMLQRKGLLPLLVPMRPAPRAGLLERLGGVYPWKLQAPPVTLAAAECGSKVDASSTDDDSHKTEQSDPELKHIQLKLDTPKDSMFP